MGVLLQLLLIAQLSQPPHTFPIPADMRETWPGAKLSETENKALRKIVKAEQYVRETKQESEFTLNTADVELGALGEAVIATPTNPILCGTGGCPIYIYVRERSGFRKVLDYFGWAFGVVDSNGKIPDMVIAANVGGGQISLRLFRYDGAHFRSRACEMLTSKSGLEPGTWWNASEVTTTPCE
jgi:hypothetical protein